MSICVILALENVFADERLEVMEHQREFYKMLSTQRTVVVSTNPDREAVVRFLRQHHYRYDLLLNKDATVVLDEVAWKVSAVRNVKATGWPVSYYLDSDPEVVRRVFSEGTVALYIAHRLARPDWLPDHRTPTAWSELIEFVEEQSDKRSAPPGREPRPWEQSVVP